MNPWVELLLHNWYIGAHEIHRDVKEPISKQTVHVIRTVQQIIWPACQQVGLCTIVELSLKGKPLDQIPPNNCKLELQCPKRSAALRSVQDRLKWGTTNYPPNTKFTPQNCSS